MKLAVDPKRVLLLGGSGLFGAALQPVLQRAGIKVLPPRSSELDIRQLVALREAVRALTPDLIINAAAQSSVDAAEQAPDDAYAVNAMGAHNVALAAAEMDLPLLHLSTDYVFDGQRAEPYREGDPTGEPLNHYGRSKLDGERLVRQTTPRHFIVRVAAMFGPGGRPDFVDRILAQATPTSPVKVVTDRVMSPTFTVDLAAQLLALMRTPYFGTYHAVGRGAASWFELAQTALQLAGSDPAGVIPITSAEQGPVAKRASYTVLDNQRLRLRKIELMRPWREALAEHLNQRA